MGRLSSTKDRFSAKARSDAAKRDAEVEKESHYLERDPHGGNDELIEKTVWDEV